jgi:hypothetical protein
MVIYSSPDDGEIRYELMQSCTKRRDKSPSLQVFWSYLNCIDSNAMSQYGSVKAKTLCQSQFF